MKAALFTINLNIKHSVLDQAFGGFYAQLGDVEKTYDIDQAQTKSKQKIGVNCYLLDLERDVPLLHDLVETCRRNMNDQKLLSYDILLFEKESDWAVYPLNGAGSHD
jgi:hypothetical protein